MVLLIRMHIAAYLLGLCILSTPLIGQQGGEAPDQVYLERNEAGEEVSYQVSRTADGLRITAQLPGGGLEEQTFSDGPNQETAAWTYRDSSRDSELEAVLNQDRTISLKGKHRGKPVDKSFKINDQPWNQAFQQGMAPFLSSFEKKTVFWAIGTRGKGEMKITRFTVRREDPAPEPVLLKQNGFDGPYQRIKISLHGLLSMFWSGHYWYEAADGDFLFYQGKSSYLEGDVTLIRKK